MNFSIRLKLFFVCIHTVVLLSAQQDTIIVHDYAQQSDNFILPVSFNSSTTFDYTSFNVGTNAGQVALSLSPPAVHLFQNSNFSDIETVSNFFPVTDFPVRTATRLFYYTNDSLVHGTCSGIMVGPDMVLTAGHCVYSYFTKSWISDSIEIGQAWHNGMLYSPLSRSMGKKAFIFKSYYDAKHWDDLALIQLKAPVGIQSGWLGMGFSSDTSWFTNKVFHKLSYPGVVSPFDSTKVYNGDTLYYNYGNIFADPSGNLLVAGTNVAAIPGQSGSSIFYTDNINWFHTFGVLSFSTNYRHQHFTNKMFYQLKNILDNYSVGIDEQLYSENQHMIIFPNPFSNSAVLNLHPDYVKLSNSDELRLNIYNNVGQLVYSKGPVNLEQNSSLIIQRNNLKSGIYFLSLIDIKGNCVRGKFVVTD